MSNVPSVEYHLRQAELAARLALAEPDPVKATALHVLSLEHYDKASKSGTAHLAMKVPILKDQMD